MAIPHFSYSFANGFNKMTLEDARKAKQEIMRILDCKHDSMYSRKKYSYRDIPAHVYASITQIFQKYGVQESDVWSTIEL